MDLISFSETFKELKPLSYFGSVRELQLLSTTLSTRLLHSEWNQSYVFALEDSWLFKIKSEYLTSLMNVSFLQLKMDLEIRQQQSLQ